MLFSLAWFLEASPLSPRVPPRVRFLEVGDRGIVFPEVPATAEVEVSADEPFQGTLDCVIRWTRDENWKEQDIVSGNRSIAELALGRGEARRLLLIFPLPGRPPDLPLVEIAWNLRERGGHGVLSGRERARGAGLGWRLLHIASASKARFWRRPAEAFDQVSRYLPYRILVIGGKDFQALGEKQKQALLGATALGKVLILVPPRAPLGERIEELSARDAALVWQGEGSAEIREVPYLAGLIRRTTLGPEAWATESPAGESPVGRLLISPHPLRPLPISGLGLRSSVRWLWDRVESLRTRSIHSRLKLAGALSALWLLATLTVLWRASRRQAPLAPKTVALVVLGLVAVPVMAYPTLASFRAGNSNYCIEVALHDENGLARLLCVTASRGGGGGSKFPALQFSLDPRAAFSAERALWLPEAPLLKTLMRRDGSIELTPVPGLTAGRRLTLDLRAWETPEPPFESDFSWKQGRLVGRLQAKRSFRSVILLHPRWSLPLGPRKPSDSIELEHFTPQPNSAGGIRALPPAESEIVDKASFGTRPLPSYSAGASLSDFPFTGGVTVVAEEAEERPATVADETGQRARLHRLHIQSFPLRRGGKLEAVMVTLPAEQRGDRLHVFVPERLYQSVLPESFLAIPVALRNLVKDLPQVAARARGGLRELVFPVTSSAPFDARPGWLHEGLVSFRLKPKEDR